MRKSIALTGVFLIVVGSVFLVFGIWYALTYGVPQDLSVRDILLPELSGNLFWLLGVSSAAIVLGIVFLLWAIKFRDPLEKQKKYEWLKCSELSKLF